MLRTNVPTTEPEPDRVSSTLPDDVQMALFMLLQWLGPGDRDDIPFEIVACRDTISDWLCNLSEAEGNK